MRRHLVPVIAVVAILLLFALEAVAGSWIFRQSTYSHDPTTGQRVDQYAIEQPPVVQHAGNYQRSGYRHQRLTLRGPDGNADRLHIVETWGAGENIRPYGEWLRPFRAGATPYGPWGNAQGPWTLPFDSWRNPYGLGQLPNPPWPHYPPYYGSPGYQPYPTPYPSGPGGHAPTGPAPVPHGSASGR